MAWDPKEEQRFSISPVDRRGRAISPRVLAVARSIADRALRLGERELGDPALAITLLEESAAVVSRVVAGEHPDRPLVRDLPAYLFRAYMRRVNRAKKRQIPLSTGVDPDPGSAEDPELKLLINEILTRCDPVIREMFYRRVQGFSWKEIGHDLGISAHAAEARYSQALQRLRKKLQSHRKDQQ